MILQLATFVSVFDLSLFLSLLTYLKCSTWWPYESGEPCLSQSRIDWMNCHKPRLKIEIYIFHLYTFSLPCWVFCLPLFSLHSLMHRNRRVVLRLHIHFFLFIECFYPVSILHFISSSQDSSSICFWQWVLKINVWYDWYKHFESARYFFCWHVRAGCVCMLANRWRERKRLLLLK